MVETKEYAKVVEHITSQIEKGTLATGSKLPTERALAEELGISRNSTREALRTMENMGVIASRQGSGNYITGEMTSSFSSMLGMMLLLEKISKRDVHAFRHMMEKAVCSILCEMGDQKELADRAEALLRSDIDPLEADSQFHFMLIEATGNQLLITLMASVSEIYRSMIADVLALSSDEMKGELEDVHLWMVRGMREGDVMLCMGAIDRHYEIIEECGALN